MPQRLPVQGAAAGSARCPCAVHVKVGPSLTGFLAAAPACVAQLLLIGDSGVGKSCLLLRFAVWRSWAGVAEAAVGGARALILVANFPAAHAG